MSNIYIDPVQAAVTAGNMINLNSIIITTIVSCANIDIFIFIILVWMSFYGKI